MAISFSDELWTTLSKCINKCLNSPFVYKNGNLPYLKIIQIDTKAFILQTFTKLVTCNSKDNLRTVSVYFLRRDDTQHNDIRYKDIQHNDTQLMTYSLMTYSIMPFTIMAALSITTNKVQHSA